MGTIRAPGENGGAVGKDRRAGPTDDDKSSFGLDELGKGRLKFCRAKCAMAAKSVGLESL